MKLDFKSLMTGVISGGILAFCIFQCLDSNTDTNVRYQAVGSVDAGVIIIDTQSGEITHRDTLERYMESF